MADYSCDFNLGIEDIVRSRDTLFFLDSSFLGPDLDAVFLMGKHRKKSVADLSVENQQAMAEGLRNSRNTLSGGYFKLQNYVISEFFKYGLTVNDIYKTYYELVSAQLGACEDPERRGELKTKLDYLDLIKYLIDDIRRVDEHSLFHISRPSIYDEIEYAMEKIVTEANDVLDLRSATAIRRYRINDAKMIAMALYIILVRGNGFGLASIDTKLRTHIHNIWELMSGQEFEEFGVPKAIGKNPVKIYNFPMSRDKFGLVMSYGGGSEPLLARPSKKHRKWKQARGLIKERLLEFFDKIKYGKHQEALR